MANYDTLPIYKASYNFLLRTMHAISHFPREYKYTLGEKIQSELISFIILIYKANSAASKVICLKQMDEQIQLLYLLLRICHDIKIMPTEKYAGIVDMINSVASQAKGWLKANEKMSESAKATA